MRTPPEALLRRILRRCLPAKHLNGLKPPFGDSPSGRAEDHRNSYAALRYLRGKRAFSLASSHLHQLERILTAHFVTAYAATLQRLHK